MAKQPGDHQTSPGHYDEESSQTISTFFFAPAGAFRVHETFKARQQTTVAGEGFGGLNGAAPYAEETQVLSGLAPRTHPT